MHSDPFTITSQGKSLDYRIPKPLDIPAISDYFTSVGYTVSEIKQDSRHTIALLNQASSRYLAKVCSTEGIALITKQEYTWNEAYSKSNHDERFAVPKNKEEGYTHQGFYYIVTDMFDGTQIAPLPQPTSLTSLNEQTINQLVEFALHIQSLSIKLRDLNETTCNLNHIDYFNYKLSSWYGKLPQKVRTEHRLQMLTERIKIGSTELKTAPRHGDFAPWHLFQLTRTHLGLIDGEHAREKGVEYYDIAYLIQRVFCVLRDKRIANRIFSVALDHGCEKDKLLIVLAARAIGGYLDSYLAQHDYSADDQLRDWVTSFPI